MKHRHHLGLALIVLALSLLAASSLARLPAPDAGGQLVAQASTKP
jgi:hypothetical protein